MTQAALAGERRDEIDEWWEGGFLGAVPMASAHEERVRFAFHDASLWGHRLRRQSHENRRPKGGLG